MFCVTYESTRLADMSKVVYTRECRTRRDAKMVIETVERLKDWGYRLIKVEEKEEKDG